MKKVFKFTMAALAATVLASCSTDDFSSIGSEKSQLTKGDLLVEVEGMKNPLSTRAMILPSEENATGTLYWQENDRIFVYDESVGVFDKYEFDETDGFELTGKGQSNLVNVKYAAFVGNDVDETHHTWNYKNNKTTLKVEIPETLDWAEANVRVEGEKKTAYMSFLPMWGQAWRVEGTEKKVGTKLHYLTAILRVDLKNVPENANYLYVRGWLSPAKNVAAPMTGTFDAVVRSDEYLGLNEEGINEEAALDPLSCTLSKEREGDNNWIRVDISKATKAKTVVFIPIVENNYSLIEVAASENPYYGSSQINTNVFGKEKVKKIEPKNKVQRAYYYSTEYNFNIAGETVDDINDALGEAEADEDGVVTITTTKNTKVGTKEGTEIKIPTIGGAKEFQLDLRGLTNVDAKDGILRITSPNGKYSELDLVLTVDGGTTSTIEHIYVDIPFANLTVKGDNLENVTLGDKYDEDNTTTGGKGYRFAPGSLNVASLTIAADGKEHNADADHNNKRTEACNNNPTTKVKAVYVNANDDLKIVTVERGAKVMENLQLEKETKVAEIVVNGIVAGLVDAEVNGTVNTKAKADQITVTLGEQSAYIGQLITNQLDFAITGTSNVGEATCAGNVTIAITQNETAVNKLTMNTYYHATNDKEAKRTLTLTGGYIGTLITSSRVNGGSNEILMENTETSDKVATAFNRGGSCNIKEYTSTWKGAPINEGAYTDQIQINTAAQLQYVNSKNNAVKVPYELMANLEMNKIGIKPLPGIWVSFHGNGKTISNLVVNSTVAGAPTGLFSEIYGRGANVANNGNSGTVSRLTIKDAIVTGKAASTGILFGKASRELTVSNVTVSGSVEVLPSKAGEKDDVNVGGLGGELNGNNTNDTLLVNTVVVNCTKIAGRYNLGGLVGKAKNVKGTKVNIAATGFEVVLPGYKVPTVVKPEAIVEYGSVGEYCGYLENSLDLTESVINTPMTLADRVNYGFMLHHLNEHWNGTAVVTGLDYTNPEMNYYWYGSTDGVTGLLGDGVQKIVINEKEYDKTAYPHQPARPEDSDSKKDSYKANVSVIGNVYTNDKDVKEILQLD